MVSRYLGIYCLLYLRSYLQYSTVQYSTARYNISIESMHPPTHHTYLRYFSTAPNTTTMTTPLHHCAINQIERNKIKQNRPSFLRAMPCLDLPRFALLSLLRHQTSNFTFPSYQNALLLLSLKPSQRKVLPVVSCRVVPCRAACTVSPTQPPTPLPFLPPTYLIISCHFLTHLNRLGILCFRLNPTRYF